MASHASFTANDNLAVVHTFTRVDIDGQTVRYQERPVGSSLGWRTVTTNLRTPQPGNGAKVYKGTVKYVHPIVVDETINGVVAAKKVREFVVETNFLIPADATDVEKAAFAAVFPNIMATATVKDMTSLLLPLNGP